MGTTFLFSVYVLRLYNGVADCHIDRQQICQWQGLFAAKTGTLDYIS